MIRHPQQVAVAVYRGLVTLALALGVGASWGAPAVSVSAASTVRIHLAGTGVYRELLARFILDDICGGAASNASTTLYNLSNEGGAFTFHSKFWAISCFMSASGAAKVGLAEGTPLAFFKSDERGSTAGVFPLMFNQRRAWALTEPTATSCSTTLELNRVYIGCPAADMRVPDVGLSFIEPQLLGGMFPAAADPLDPSDDNYSALYDQDFRRQLVVRPIVQAVMAVVVNQRLYEAMFEKQGLSSVSVNGVRCTTSSSADVCQVSIGIGEARSLFTGTEPSWRLLSNSADLVSSQLNLCRYSKGSGVQAAADLHLLGSPVCEGNPLIAASWDYSTSPSPEFVSPTVGTTESGRSISSYLIANMGAGLGTGPMPQDTTFVFEGPDTEAVAACLSRAQSAGGYAIGHMPRIVTPGSSWRYVRLEGAVPTRDAAKTGQYDYTFESTLQWRVDRFASLTSAQRAFINGMAIELGKSDSLARLGTSARLGVAALPVSYASAFGMGSVQERNFGSRVTRAGNSCNRLTAVK